MSSSPRVPSPQASAGCCLLGGPPSRVCPTPGPRLVPPSTFWLVSPQRYSQCMEGRTVSSHSGHALGVPQMCERLSGQGGCTGRVTPVCGRNGARSLRTHHGPAPGGYLAGQHGPQRRGCKPCPWRRSSARGWWEVTSLAVRRDQDAGSQGGRSWTSHPLEGCCAVPASRGGCRNTLHGVCLLRGVSGASQF